MQRDNGQYRNEMYKRAENMIPQLDGTYNISDSSDTDLHDYLDLASTNIIQYRTRGQKQRHEENEMAYTNRRSAHIEYMLGSNCKVAPFIKGAAPTCNCKLEHPFIKGAAPTFKVHLAPFINRASCSIYKVSSSNCKCLILLN